MPHSGRRLLRVRRLTARPPADTAAAPRRGGSSLRASIPERTERIRDLARSSPGRLALIGAVLVLLALGSGAAAGLSTNAREHRIDTLRTSTEPLADAAQELYAALSIADASASTAFLAGGLQPQAMVDRYNDAIDSASSALTAAAMGADSDDAAARDLITTISTRLPVYTALVATADANNRAGNPVGVNYLGEASAMMQDQLLPRAEQLYTAKAASVRSAQQHNARITWIPLLVSAVAVACLIAAQFYLTRTNHRRINPGLAAATVAVGLVFLWTLVAGLIATGYSEHAYDEGTAPLRNLTAARITGQQARAAETRSLMTRGAGATAATPFGQRAYQIETSLAAAGIGPEDSDELTYLDGWRLTHAEMRGYLAAGQYREAVSVAIGDGPRDGTQPDGASQDGGDQSGGDQSGGDQDGTSQDGMPGTAPEGSSAEQFDALDSSLAQRIDSARNRGSDLTGRSADATRFLTVGTGILAGIAALAVILGMWPRIIEYR